MVSCTYDKICLMQLFWTFNLATVLASFPKIGRNLFNLMVTLGGKIGPAVKGKKGLFFVLVLTFFG